jgi:cytosine/adenosine deaminase-related metal-dependent hydrolase
MVHTEHTELAPLNVAEGFYLLTLGGARVLDIDDKVGNFLVGKVLPLPLCLLGLSLDLLS